MWRNLRTTLLLFTLIESRNRLRWRKLRCIFILRLSQNVNFASLCSLWHHNRDRIIFMMEHRAVRQVEKRVSSWSMKFQCYDEIERKLFVNSGKQNRQWLWRDVEWRRRNSYNEQKLIEYVKYRHWISLYGQQFIGDWKTIINFLFLTLC